MSEPTTTMTRYVARYIIIDPTGNTLVYSGICDLHSDQMKIDDPNPGVRGFYLGISAETIRQDCDRRGGVPAGRVVIVGMEESDVPVGHWAISVPAIIVNA